MNWTDASGAMALMAVLWLTPGYLVLRLLGVRGILAVGAAAPVTAGLSGMLAIAYGVLGIAWSLVSFGVGMAGFVLVSAVLGRLCRRHMDDPYLMSAGARPLASREITALSLTWLLGGGVLGAAMMSGMGQPSQPPQAWDAVFHLNAVWFIQDEGNASSMGGLTSMYGGTIAPFYPATWHGLVAIAPGFGGITEAANASSVLIGTVIWIAGLVALARVVWPRHVLPALVVPVLAASYVTFPAIALSMLAVWPFALSVSCLPGTIALLVVLLRGHRGWQQYLRLGIGVLVATAGVVLAHASGVFGLILLVLPLVVVLVGRQLRRLARAGHPAWAWGTGLSLSTLVLAILVFLVTFPPVRSIMDYERGGQDSYWPPLGSLLIDHPLIYVYRVTSVNVIGTLLVLLGVLLTIRWRHARWLVVAWLSALGLTLLAAGPPENPVRVLAGFWYTQPSRINQLLLIPAIMLAAGAAGWLAHQIARRLTRPGPVHGPVLEPGRWQQVAGGGLIVVMIVILTSGLRWTTQTQVMASTYTTYPIAWGTILEPEEIDMIDRAAQTLPADAMVLGEAVAGSPYLLHRSGVRVVFPQLSPIPHSPERAVLETSFRDWESDPEVCAAVRELGVTHVYADSLNFYDELNAKWEERTPGLRNLTPIPGGHWRKVDEGGHASLWEFTGCSQQ